MHPQHNKKTLEGKKRNKELGELKWEKKKCHKSCVFDLDNWTFIMALKTGFKWKFMTPMTFLSISFKNCEILF
jgi:hypothetical protein